MTTYRPRQGAPTLGDMGEPTAQPAPQPETRQRTPHGDALMFGSATLAVLSLVAVLGHALDLPRVWWAVVTAAVAMLAATAAALAARAVTALWWVLAAAAAGTWLAWSRFADLRTPAPWLWLAGPAAVLLGAWPLLAQAAARRAETARRRQADIERRREENYWPALLDRLGHKGIRVTGREATRNGYALTLRLPATGKVTWRNLAKDTERLEVAAGMRHGSLRFEPGEIAHDVLLFVSTVDVLAQTVPYVDDGRPLSIRNPIPVGLYEDGTVCSLTLREVCVLIVGLRGSGKALALDTPIATPSGWTSMGEVKPGDWVYDEMGKPCRVLAATGIMHGRPCYEVTFSDGSVITADASHQWLVDTDASRRSERAKHSPRSRLRPDVNWNHSQDHLRKRPEVLTTEQMIPGLRMLRRSGVTADGGVNNYSVRVAAPLQGVPSELLVPPYTLGAWLGDGTTSAGSITSADPEIIAEVDQEMRALLLSDRPSISEIRSWPERVTVPEAARALGIGAVTAWALIRRGQFPAVACQQDRSKCPAGHLYDAVTASGSPKCTKCSNAASVRYRARQRGAPGAPEKLPQPCRVMVDRGSLIEAAEAERFTWPQPSTVKENHANYWVKGLSPRLRGLGVLGDKHIPAQYLRAPEPQRRALLAGLLDTDGHCTKTGAVEFCSTNEHLARDVRHLVCGLGYKASLRSKIARLNGKDCGTAWTVSFTTAEKMFRLPRKLARQVTKVRSTAPHRYITSIWPVPSVPVRCIQVDSPSHLYLAGESCIPTHNSSLLMLLVAQLVRCVDCLLFLIDTKHRLVMPWVQPYLADPQAGEAVEWAVTDRAGTEAMLRALLEAIRQRSAAGSGGEKLEPTPHEPAVVTVVDEVASIFGEGRGPRYSAEGTTNTTLAGIGSEAIQLGRSEAVDFILATQRGTVTMVGSGDLKSQCAVRIGLRVASEADARLVFPDDQHAAQLLAALKHPGSGLLMEDQDARIAPVKFFRLEPQQIPEIARRYGPLKPAPDPVLERALGEAYQQRWDAFRAARKHTALAPALADTRREFERITARLPDVEESDPANAAHRRMREFMARAGERGVTVSMIASLLDSEHMGVSERTVRNWLSADIELGIVERLTHGMYRLQHRQEG